MSLISQEGTESGTTAILIDETIGAGHILKIKAYETQPTLPTYNDDLSLWTDYTEGNDFETTDGYYVVVCECSASAKALKGGYVVAEVKE